MSPKQKKEIKNVESDKKILSPESELHVEKLKEDFDDLATDTFNAVKSIRGDLDERIETVKKELAEKSETVKKSVNSQVKNISNSPIMNNETHSNTLPNILSVVAILLALTAIFAVLYSGKHNKQADNAVGTEIQQIQKTTADKLNALEQKLQDSEAATQEAINKDKVTSALSLMKTRLDANASATALQQEIASIRETITAVKPTSSPQLQKMLSNLETRLNLVEASLDDTETAVEELQRAIDSLK